MRLAIIHISDIHFSDGRKNLAETYIPLVASGLPPTLLDARLILIAISGDIAFSGLHDEYKRAVAAFAGLVTELDNRYPQARIVAIPAPGNHDCDFDKSTSIRDALLRSASFDSDVEYVSQCAVVQHGYRRFVAELPGRPTPVRSNATSDEYIIELEPQHILRVVSFNSAWASSKNEAPGSLLIPSCAFFAGGGTQSACSIAMFHHPYGWLHQSVVHDVKQCVETNFDLVLTGHEHTPDLFRKTRDSGGIDYLEGAVFQESATKASGAFRLVEVDLKSSHYRSMLFSFQDGLGVFRETPELESHQFLRNAARARNDFVLQPDAAHMLDDLGDVYLHPRKDRLTIDDVFVAPDCLVRRLTIQIENAPRKQLNIDSIIAQKAAVIIGPEASGKTTAARRCFAWLRERGFIPHLLRGDELVSSATDDVSALIERNIRETYGPTAAERYRLLGPERRSVIIDDFDRCRVSWLTRLELLSFLIRYHGVVILTSQLDPVVDIATSGQDSALSASISLLDNFHLWQIQELGNERRYELVAKWCLTGLRYSEDENVIQRKVVHYHETIGNAASKRLVPIHPMFVLLCLQQLDSSQHLEIGGGTFGYLYEAYLTTSLLQVDTKLDLDLRHNFLAELAEMLRESSAAAVSATEFVAVVARYNDKYATAESPERVLQACVPLLVSDGGEVRFKHKYAFYYYLARYLRDHLHDADAKNIVDDYCDALHLELHGNVLMFLCHLTKDPVVLDAVAAKAKSLFEGVRVLTLKGASESIGVAPDREVKIVERPLHERRKEMYRAEDDVEAAVDLVTPEALEVKFVSDTSAAFRCVQVIGQVLRGFHGSLTAQRKEELASLAYSLTLRTISAWFEWAKDNKGDLVAFLSQLFGERRDFDEPSQADAAALRFLFYLLEGFSTYGLLHIAEALGRETLAKTFDALLRSEADKEGVRLIDLAIRIQVNARFPEERAFELWKDSKHQLARNIIRNLVTRHMYLFPMDTKVRQRMCERFNIRWIEPVNRGAQFVLPPGKAPKKRTQRRRRTAKQRKRP